MSLQELLETMEMWIMQETSTLEPDYHMISHVARSLADIDDTMRRRLSAGHCGDEARQMWEKPE